MPDTKTSHRRNVPRLVLQAAVPSPAEYPPLLRAGHRSGDGEIDPLLSGVAVENRYRLQAATRGERPLDPVPVVGDGARVLALEAEDGTTIFIHADRLVAEVERLRPDALIDGAVDLHRFVDSEAKQRGLVDVVWKAVSVLRLPEDGLAEQALDLAGRWAGEALQDMSAEPVLSTASFLGAKALMWTIESRLAGRPGLYCWQGRTITADDRCQAGDRRLQSAATGQPMLLLIHGTGSYTVGSFADLQADESSWRALLARFPGGVFGYEHRTFSQSPVENAVEVLLALPEGARVSLVTHSRGGLVGDLLCLGQVDDEAIDGYRIPLVGTKDRTGLEREAAEERGRLRQVVGLIAERRIQIERYVRVACPARGTRFLSDNLEVALSDLLNLMQWGGGALVGAVGAAVGGPAAGESLGRGASSAIGVLKRLVLEIAGRRVDPRLIPGLAAMRTDSPLAAFLAHTGTRRRDGIDMAIIAGDTEFSGIGLTHLGRRVANLFCDWRLFDDHDNDLVVDTDSMYAGLGLRDGARYLYDRGESVSHFRYFTNQSTRHALRGWLVDDPKDLPQFQLLNEERKRSWQDLDTRCSRGLHGSRPVIILVPGMMGSHLAHQGMKPNEVDRICFGLSHLALGHFARIADLAAPGIVAEDLWERGYGDLAAYLAESHEVVRCPYDWRQPIARCADTLAEKIEAARRDHPGQAVSLLAHGMGGLVVRALMAGNPDCWQQIVASGGYLLMLGTPNHGAHSMVHALLGKSRGLRGLEKLDRKHDLPAILDIVAGFPGALALLPRPGCVEAGDAACLASEDYYRQGTWKDLRAANTDRWYGKSIGAVPEASLLDDAQQFWARLPVDDLPNPERVSYVFGQGEKTPCGVAKGADGRLQWLFTNEGDGLVTWESGRLSCLSDGDRCWILPVEHADLAAEEAYFPALQELLTTGRTMRLERAPRLRAGKTKTFALDAPPPVVPGEDELVRAMHGSGPRRRRYTRPSTLTVAVRAGDLRFIDQPLICGHFSGDPIAAAEAVLDRELDGRLSERERLGVYAGPIGSSAIVLPPRSEGQSERGSRPGAIIVGLGDFNGQLGSRQITETVRAAVLRLLLLLRDTRVARSSAPVQLYSLLLGCNSTAHLSIAESVAAVTCGVLEANGQFGQALGKSDGIAVSSLTFIEIFRDAAISAAHAVVALPQALADTLRRLNARCEVARCLEVGRGVRERLSADDGEEGYWSRLVVSDAGSPASEALAAGLTDSRPDPATAEGVGAASAVSPADSAYLPERLKYVFLSKRARAETVVQQRQPGLIETIVRRQRLDCRNNPSLARTLFHLMVPVDYKGAARERARLLLILDSYTASLPWELLQADDLPLAVRTPMVRQLMTSRFRGGVATASANAACLIVSPSTEGFNQRFGGSATALDKLPGAVEEGEGIRDTLREAGWSNIAFCGESPEALDVLAELYRQPYRVLAICGHGLFEAQGLDGRTYTGAVLSDGILLGAVEIELMEVVPEIVFLSCCYLGSMSHDAQQPNRLAYSLARALIDIGVRGVVAAGWAVEDKAAKTFATTFFARLAAGDAFGEAVFAARRVTYDRHPGSNTWGAYQAYGDPGYRLAPAGAGRRAADSAYVAVEELLDSLARRRLRYAGRDGDGRRPAYTEEAAWIRGELARCPEEWTRRPDVLQALGSLYAELGDDGFSAAREAWLAALQGEDDAERVACRVIEQLANIEARYGDKWVAGGSYARGCELIDCAIGRLRALDQAVGRAQAANAERTALLASALKRKAGAQAQSGSADWSAVREIVTEAAQTYFTAGGGGSAACPYPTLNALALAWLAGLPSLVVDGAERARACAQVASKRFSENPNFWDATAGADAAMVVWLLSGETSDAGDTLRTAYRELARDVAQSRREWDSVRRHLHLLASLLELRGQPGDGERAVTLRGLVEGLVS